MVERDIFKMTQNGRRTFPRNEPYPCFLITGILEEGANFAFRLSPIS
jgi:hypothetical protein